MACAQLFGKAVLYRMVAPARSGHREQVIDEHIDIIAALADRDPGASAQAIRAHVNHQVPNEIREQASQFFPAKPYRNNSPCDKRPPPGQIARTERD